ncbi:MAG: glycosyltransferase [Armatimonadota bacterium]|nr:MAG: glycosyltransferase [Armatimonadota bacterium]
MSALTILHLLPWLNYGGVEKYVIGLSAALQRRGHRCIIVSSGGKLEGEADAAGIRHIPLHIRGRRGLSAVPRLAAIIDREHVDLLAAHNWTAGAVGFLASRLARIPYCFTVHGMREPIQRFLVYYWGEKVITVSAAGRDHLIRKFHLPPQRVVTSVIGVDAERFRPGPPALSLVHELGLDRAAPKIVHVSRFSRGKGEVALRLIEAARGIEGTAPGFQAIIAGVGALADEIAARADDANRGLGRRAFVFVGGRSDVPELMSLADVVVGTATVALEAMACGKPVVAAGKAGFVGVVTPETLAAANATCFGDHAAPERVTFDNLAGAIGGVLSDASRGEELREFSRRAVLRSFTMGHAAESVERVYGDVLSGSRPVRRIAAFHLNQVGDLLFSLPTLAALRRRFPHAEITSVLRPNLAELMQECPFIDNVILRRGGVAREIRVAQELRRRGVDVAVAFSQSSSTALQTFVCGARTRIGFVDADTGWLLNRRVHVRGLPWPGKLGRLAICLGADAPGSSYVGMLRIPSAVRKRAGALLQGHGVESAARLAVIAPAASGRQRYKGWYPARFAEVGDYLHERWRTTVVLVGAPGEAVEVSRVASAMSARAVNLTGETSTGELAAILERADLLVGVDSGPVHLAAAMGTPVVVLFGPTDPSRTAPQGEGHEVVTAGLDCGPCTKPCATMECMKAITVELVTAAVDKVFARAK